MEKLVVRRNLLSLWPYSSTTFKNVVDWNMSLETAKESSKNSVINMETTWCLKNHDPSQVVTGGLSDSSTLNGT